jgi:hypothetical protein
VAISKLDYDADDVKNNFWIAALDGCYET